MEGKRSLFYAFIVFAALGLYYGLSLIVPAQMIIAMTQYVRHGVYAVLLVGLLLLFGRDRRPVRKAYNANMGAVIALLLYFCMVMLSSFWFGGGRNIMTPNFLAVVNNLRIFALPVLAGEYIRFRLIRSAKERDRLFVVIMLTLVFAAANMTGLRSFVSADEREWLNFLFESVLPSVTVSAVLSFMCVRGSLFSVMLVSFVYNLGGTFSPILPTFEHIVWALLVSGLVFVVGVIHYYLTDDKNTAQRKRIARASKYAEGNPVGRGFGLLAVVMLVLFFLQVFPFYPVVILTGSMSGYIDRGSLVVMRRVPEDEVANRVQVGTVLHYNMGQIEIVHRVIDYVYHGEERAFITQGDANPFPDPTPLAQADVIGTPVFVIPFIGYPNIAFRAITGGVF
jgi:signal peptidase